MTTNADQLWRANNEYRKRLGQAQTFFGLLEAVVLGAPVDARQAELVRWARAHVESIVQELREWRERFYYQDPGTRRMVQADGAIYDALTSFDRMRGDQEVRLHTVYTTLLNEPRPDPRLTRVPQGDLWLMAGNAIYDLLGFSEYLVGLQAAS
jgi:hypothetical protein